MSHPIHRVVRVKKTKTVLQQRTNYQSPRWRAEELADELRLRPVTDAEWCRIMDNSHFEGDCLIWDGYRENGYAVYSFRNGRTHVYRVTFAAVVGEPIAKGLQPDHDCRNRACISPDHLVAMTARENILKGAGIAARRAIATECDRKHPFDEANTYISPQGYRFCRECKRQSSRRRYAERKANAV